MVSSIETTATRRNSKMHEEQMVLVGWIPTGALFREVSASCAFFDNAYRLEWFLFRALRSQDILPLLRCWTWRESDRLADSLPKIPVMNNGELGVQGLLLSG